MISSSSRNGIDETTWSQGYSVVAPAPLVSSVTTASFHPTIHVASRPWTCWTSINGRADATAGAITRAIVSARAERTAWASGDLVRMGG